MMLLEVNVRILSVILLLGFITGGNAIVCYVCNSESSAQCETNPQVFERDCEKENKSIGVTKYDVCRKIIQDITWSYEIPGRDCPPGNHHRVIRACGMKQEPQDKPGDCFWRGFAGSKSSYCVCDEDKCNASSMSLSSFLLVVASSLYSALC